MDTNLTQRILETIDYSGGLIKQGIEFSKEQAPLVVQEFLTWSFWNACISTVLYSIMAVVLIGCAIRFWKKAFKLSEDTWMPVFFVNIIGVIIGTVAIFLAIDNFRDAVKVKLAPRVYLIEWAASQVRGNK